VVDFTGAGLTGANRDAAVALTALFKSYGLESLAPRIVEFIKQGYSADTVGVLLVDTDEYKKRFAANDARIKKGLPALAPREYLATEAAYREVMQSAGVPAGFYDQPADFEKWLVDDVSPSEIKTRVDAATEMVNSLDENTLAEFKRFYTTGDIIAFALDQKRAAPLVGKAFEAAKIAGAAAAQDLRIDVGTAEQLAGQGVNRQQAQQGFGFIADEQENVDKLADISGTDRLTQSDLVDEVFFNDADAAERRRTLADQEKARFGGSSGVGGSSLSTGGSGSL
jgi:hypothetical protein